MMNRHTKMSRAIQPVLLGTVGSYVLAAQIAFAADVPQQTKPAPVKSAAATVTAQAAPPAVPAPAAAQPLPAQLSLAPAQLGPPMDLFAGKSTLLRLQDPIDRISVGNPSIADVTVISQREIYLLGKSLGTTNIIVWSKSGQATVNDATVNADLTPLEAELKLLLPEEKDITVTSAAGSIVLRGTVADAVKADHAVAVAEAWRARLTRDLVLPVQSGEGNTTISVGGGGTVRESGAAAGPRVINMLKVRDPQQVMLEVKVAEVSKTLLERIGVTLSQIGTSGQSILSFVSKSNFMDQLLGAAAIARPTSIAGQVAIEGVALDAQKDDGLLKMLAEPNIMAISGQEASFRAGGRIFIPVARDNGTGGTTITLEEKEFGVGLKFKPTVLEGGRINLKVAPEVSELNSTGSPFTTVGGVTSVLPSFSVRRAETTVQLNDGQSFMIAGLIKHDVAETVNR